MLFDKTAEKRDVIVACVKGRNVVERLPSRCDERLGVAYRDLLEGFQTIGSETGTNDVKSFYAFTAEIGDDLIGIGPQPFGAPESGLKRNEPVVVSEFERLGNETGGFLTLTVIRVAI